jgi:hypothetical protein
LQDRFGREAFRYDVEQNCYFCPQGMELKFSNSQQKNGKTIHHYRSSVPVCVGCPVNKHCLPAKTQRRTVTRWEYEQIIEDHRQRMKKDGPRMMAERKCLAEHPFGTLKRWCGWIHFLMRGLDKVRAEFSLLVLCYNFRRVLSILGADGLRVYCLHWAKRLSASG